MSEQLHSQENREPTPVESGLLQSIASRIGQVRISRLEGKIEDLEETDHVIRSAPEQTKVVRGFKSLHNSPGTEPIKVTEKLAYRRREGQSVRKRRRDREAWRSSEVYGDSGSNERQSRQAKKAERSDARRIKSINYKNERMEKSLQRGEEGRTAHAKYRSMRIERSRKKLEELHQKYGKEDNSELED